jgi:hypothetical protein
MLDGISPSFWLADLRHAIKHGAIAQTAARGIGGKTRLVRRLWGSASLRFCCGPVSEASESVLPAAACASYNGLTIRADGSA